jgi:hypothetical protein
MNALPCSGCHAVSEIGSLCSSARMPRFVHRCSDRCVLFVYQLRFRCGAALAG